MIRLITAVGLLLIVANTFATVKVASVFTDNMVLQRDSKVPVWGNADGGEAITVSFNSEDYKTKADKSGNWKLYLNPSKANATPQSLTVKGESNTVTLSGILVGDVWIMGGQSNMNKTVKTVIDKDHILENADNSLIRFFSVPSKVATTPQNSVKAVWEISDKKKIQTLSAIGAIFAEKIQPEIGIPVGIISVNLGSSSVECWVPQEMLEKEPFLPTYKYWQKVINSWDNGGSDKFLKQQQKRAQKKNQPLPTKETMVKATESRTYPSGAYNAMLNPLFPYAVKGVVWRQGEANSDRAVQYTQLLPLMIEHWRQKFENDQMPFYQIGLPAYGKPADILGVSIVAELRDAQMIVAQKVDNCYYVPIIDVIDFTKNGQGSIHPRNKYPAGIRSANLVLNIEYNKMDYEIPVFKSQKIEGNKIVLTFDNTAGNLISGTLGDKFGTKVNKSDSPINNFIIAGSNKKFVKAQAKIVSPNTVEVWSDEVSSPVAVRYAWENLVKDINLYNADNVPVSSFRTDNWKLSTADNVKPRINLVRASK